MHLRWRSGEAAAITLAGTASTGPASHLAFAFGFGRKLAAAVPPAGRGDQAHMIPEFRALASMSPGSTGRG